MTDAASLYEAAREAVRDQRLAVAERLLRQALRAVKRRPSETDPPPERLVMTLAFVRTERGHVDEGLRLLDDVLRRSHDLPDEQGRRLRGLVASQRGLIVLRTGDLAGALELFGTAVDALRDDPAELLRALGNRGLLSLFLGRLAQARADFGAVIELGEQLGQDVLVLQTRHNFAYLDLLAGDLPGALSGMDAAARGLSELDPHAMSVLLLDRARARHGAGLLLEADEDLRQAVALFAEQGAVQNQGECELLRALIALTQGEYRDARRFARQAQQRFARRGSTNWALVARLAELRADLNLGRRPAVLASAAEQLAIELAGASLAEDARMARLLAVRAHVLARDPGSAERLLLNGSRRRGSEGIITRVYARQARAEYRRATGNAAAAKRELVAGLRELHRYQASFGSLDLQTAVVRHGRSLAAQGLSAALAGSRPAEVFAWSERARAMASRLPPVRPPQDEEAAALLQELRYVRTELRTAELSGREDPVLRRRRAELETTIRQRSWYLPGPGDVEEPATLTALREALQGQPGATLVAHMVVADRVHALVVTARRGRVVPLGPVEPALAAIRRVQADLDALALQRVPAPIRRSVLGSVRRSVAALHDALWAPLAGAVGDGPVLLVPAGCLVAAPWTMLPALQGRPVALARSATAWLHQDALAVRLDDATKVVLAAGPDLLRAEEEITRSAALWSGRSGPRTDAVSLRGADATGERVLAATDGADIAHLAAHGIHEAANPLFAALRLADGPLFGYDLARLTDVPRLVLLSSCDLGRVTERPGEEVVGMTAALLHRGVGTVVASVARVSDDVACEVTLAVHDGLRRGLSPSAALAAATDGADAAPFVAFGRGW